MRCGAHLGECAEGLQLPGHGTDEAHLAPRRRHEQLVLRAPPLTCHRQAVSLLSIGTVDQWETHPHVK
jgi:hypothetical protein